MLSSAFASLSSPVESPEECKFRSLSIIGLFADEI